MITAIIIITLAFIWLGYETDWLRVKLCLVLDDADIELEFDNSDYDYLPDYERQLNEAIEDAAYQAWLDEQRSPKYNWFPTYKLNGMEMIQGNYIDSKDKLELISEQLTKRRRGEMLYQRKK